MITAKRKEKKVKIVRRNFTFPRDFDDKIKRLMEEYGCVSKSELLRKAIQKLEDERKPKKN